MCAFVLSLFGLFIFEIRSFRIKFVTKLIIVVPAMNSYHVLIKMPLQLSKLSLGRQGSGVQCIIYVFIDVAAIFGT